MNRREMMWAAILCVLGVTAWGEHLPEPVTLEPPSLLHLERWNEWHECLTDPGWPIVICNQTTTIEWSVNNPPDVRTSGEWCYVANYHYDGPSVPVPHRNTSPYCLRFDRDRDFDVDLADYAIWQREHRPPREPWNPDLEVLRFCRHGGCWVVFWHEGEGGDCTPYLVKLPE